MSKEYKKNMHFLAHGGMVTIPFLLVLAIILFFILSFFGLAMTLAHVSITQYMSYSTARKLSLGGDTGAQQGQSAVDHYKELRDQFFNPNAHVGGPGQWFLIEKEIHGTSKLGHSRIGYLKGYPDSHFMASSPHDPRGMFYGAGVKFESNIVRLRIPFLIKGPASGSYRARIISFLGREPSKAECEDFNGKRGLEIKSDYSTLSGFDTSLFSSGGDNGC